MFYFPEETLVNKVINKEDIAKLLFKKNDEVPDDFDIVRSVKIAYILNQKTMKIQSKGDFSEIYVIKIGLNAPNIPTKFLKKFDDYIEIPTIYIVQYKSFENYILSMKTRKEFGAEFNRVFVYGWGNKLRLPLPNCEFIEDIYYRIIETFTNLPFKPKENYYNYTQRLINQKRLNKTIDKGYRNFDFAKYLIDISYKRWHKDFVGILYKYIERKFCESYKITSKYKRELFDNLFKELKESFYYGFKIVNNKLESDFVESYYTNIYRLDIESLLEFNLSIDELLQAIDCVLDIKYTSNNRIMQICCEVDKLYKKISIISKYNTRYEQKSFEESEINIRRKKRKPAEEVRCKLSEDELKKYFPDK